MAVNKKTVKDLDVAGKTVLLRADYNVPLKNGQILNDLRIKGNLPTLRYLLENGAAVVACSHLGRPEGKPNLEYSLRPVAKRLEELLGQSVIFVEDCISEEAQQARRPGEVVLLENLRFHAQEEADDAEFAKLLAAGKDLYVDDAFGVVHHPAASLVSITDLLPSAAGLLLTKEIELITEAIDNPKRPLVAVFGGAKIADKIELLNNFIDKAQYLLIGGAMANTFFKALGHEIGNSKYDAEDLDRANEILANAKTKGVEVVLADKDVVVANSIDDASGKRVCSLADMRADEMILDIGPESLKVWQGITDQAGTVIWNGTLGVTEVEAFAEGSRQFADMLAASSADVIVGGGDTAGFIDEVGMTPSFKHVSTGGGASLELMAGKSLPGIEALQDKEPKA